jgi:Zn-dependent protease with chaperone function
VTGALAPTVLLAVISAGSVAAAVSLRSAAWPRRSPGVAIVLWQALGLAWGLAAVGALAEPAIVAYRSGSGGSVLVMARRFVTDVSIPPARGTMPALLAVLRMVSFAAGAALLTLLCSVLIAALVAVVSARNRQRELLALLAHGDPRIPGTLVVDHPTAAAYCVPGLRSKIVVSAGTLSLLDRAELAAVIAHERAHLRERHDLVLLPFTALLRAFPRSHLAAASHRAVSLLVEMLADDRARRQRPARELATALLRFGVAGAGPAPSGALAATGAAPAPREGGGAAHGGTAEPAAAGDVAAIAAQSAVRCDVAARVSRLLEPAPGLSRPAMAAVVASAAVLVVAPVALILLPT